MLIPSQPRTMKCKMVHPAFYQPSAIWRTTRLLMHSRSVWQRVCIYSDVISETRGGGGISCQVIYTPQGHNRGPVETSRNYLL